MTIPTAVDPAAQDAKQRAEEKRRAIKELERLAGLPLLLRRPVVFVPGWAGEEGLCWMQPYAGLPAGHGPIRAWIERLVPKANRDACVRYVTFSEAESKACATVLEFVPLLKAKIRAVIPEGAPFDFVGHSMAGLEVIAAVTQSPEPLRGIVNCIAAACPLQGIFYGKLVRPIDELLPSLNWKPHHYEQVRNLNSTSATVRLLNRLETRERFLANLEAFHEIEGTQDMVVMRSARLRRDGLSPAARRKITHTDIGGAMHIDRAGITQDPRTVLRILQILGGLAA